MDILNIFIRMVMILGGNKKKWTSLAENVKRRCSHPFSDFMINFIVY
jgi:hypothetical protein